MKTSIIIAIVSDACHVEPINLCRLTCVDVGRFVRRKDFDRVEFFGRADAVSTEIAQFGNQLLTSRANVEGQPIVWFDLQQELVSNK